MAMIIKKRNGIPQTYSGDKIKQAVSLAFASVNEPVDEDTLDKILKDVEAKFPLGRSTDFSLTVEEIQDMVELTLMEENRYKVLKSYILYRQQRSGMRHARQALLLHFPDYPQLEEVLRQIQKEYTAEDYSIQQLTHKFIGMIKENSSQSEKLTMLIKSAVELTTQEAPGWEMIASRLLYLDFSQKLAKNTASLGIQDFYSKLRYLTQEKLYGSYILDSYSREEIEEFSGWIREERNNLMNYSGLELLLGRYVIRTRKNVPLETPQEVSTSTPLTQCP